MCPFILNKTLCSSKVRLCIEIPNIFRTIVATIAFGFINNTRSGENDLSVFAMKFDSATCSWDNTKSAGGY